MLYSYHRLLSYFSDINTFYNNCMMYDTLKDMLREACLDAYIKGYEDCKIDAANEANKEGSYGYISAAELMKLQHVNHKESEGV